MLYGTQAAADRGNAARMTVFVTNSELSIRLKSRYRLLAVEEVDVVVLRVRVVAPRVAQRASLRPPTAR